MKTLYITRHAKTHPAGPGEDDFDRKLTTRGAVDLGLISSELINNRWIPEVLLCSPASRAKDSAVFLQDKFGQVEIHSEDFLYGYYNLKELITLLHLKFRDFSSVMLVAHNPVLANIADELTGKFSQHLPTSGTLIIDFYIEEWNQVTRQSGVIRSFIYPKMMR